MMPRLHRRATPRRLAGLLALAFVAGCARLQVEERDAVDPVLATAAGPPSQPGANDTAACDLARAALRAPSDVATTRSALGVLPCGDDDGALLAALWDSVPADTARLVPLLGASRRVGGQAPLDAALRALRDSARPAAVRMDAIALLAAYVDPSLYVEPRDTAAAARGGPTPPALLLRQEHAGLAGRAAYSADAPDTVVAALAAMAKRDPSRAVQRLAQAVHTDLVRRMRDADWRRGEQARRVGTEGTAAGCYLLQLFRWPADTLPGYARAFTPPSRFELVAGVDSTEVVPGARRLEPQVTGARASWWVHAPDSVTVRWASADAGLMLRVKVTAKDLFGTALAYTGPGGAELVTRVMATRVNCRK